MSAASDQLDIIRSKIESGAVNPQNCESTVGISRLEYYHLLALLQESEGVAGAANVATSQVTSTDTAATLVDARPGRRSVLIRNTDATNSVWVGPATVTSGNGFLLKGGEAVAIDGTGLLQVIDDGTNHCVVAVMETYDD